MIFAILGVLLVPFVYGSASISDACAEPSGSMTCYRTGTLTRKCCQDHIINRSPANPAGTLVTYCTDCKVGPGGTTVECGERYIEMGAEQPLTPVPPAAVARLQEGGVLGEATALPNLSESVGPRWGEVLQMENNLTFSQVNLSSSNSSNNILGLKQSDLVSDEVENSTRTVNEGEEQDKTGTSEEVTGQDENNDGEDKDENDVKDNDNNNEDSQPQE